MNSWRTCRTKLNHSFHRLPQQSIGDLKGAQWDKSDFTPWRNGGQTLGVFICLITDVHSSPSRLSPATVILHTSGLADTFSKYPAAIRLDNDLLAVGFVTSR